MAAHLNMERRTSMKQATAKRSAGEIDALFRSLNLETEEQRSAMRFERFIAEEPHPIHVVVTDSTSTQVTATENERIA
jgi:hypothetical protein